jgi:uncharacterized surface protein with fasciclin (FAS1) repeats
MKNPFLLALAATLLSVSTAFAQADSTGKDLISSAMLSKEHTKMIGMLRVAGLDGKAKEAGPYTIFAPTNAAFDKLPGGTVDNLLKPPSRPRLIQILTLHVVPGRLQLADLQDGQPLKTVNGTMLSVSRINDLVTITDGNGNKATITRANIRTTNGIVHVVDTVLLPK